MNTFVFHKRYICNVNSENGFSQQHKRFLTRYVSVIFFSQGFYDRFFFIIHVSILPLPFRIIKTITFKSISRENTISCFPNELRHAIFFRAYNQNWWNGTFQKIIFCSTYLSFEFMFVQLKLKTTYMYYNIDLKFYIASW